MRYRYIIVSILYLTAITTIFLTNYIDGYENFLYQMSYENSFFETVGTLFLFGGFTYGIYSIYKYKFKKADKIVIVVLTILFFIASMEEISWGQQIFNFPSSQFFLENNLQEETNLHNLISGNLFSSIIYSTIYITLILIPIFIKINPHIKEIKIAKYFEFDINIILIFLFASSFQLYFYKDFGVIIDMITYIISLLVVGYFILKNENSPKTRIHFAVILLTTIISLTSYKIYSFYNMQYEIREAFIEIGIVLLFIEYITKNREKNI